MDIKKNFFRGFNKIEKTQSKIATKQVNPMTFDEEKRFKEYLINNSHPFRNLVLIELYTGMRLGEIIALNISDVDIKSNTIYVSKILTHDENALDGIVVTFSPKTTSCILSFTNL